MKKGSGFYYTLEENKTNNTALNKVVIEIGIKEDPSFPGDGFGARTPAVSGPAAAPPGEISEKNWFQIKKFQTRKHLNSKSHN